jgi:hypothetical protein
MKFAQVSQNMVLLVLGRFQQALVSLAAEVSSSNHLEIGSTFATLDLKRFKAMPGCEADAAGVVSCSVVATSGELYVVFEGWVVRVDVEASDLAFSFCEFEGLTAESTVEQVKDWANARSAQVIDRQPPDAPEPRIVLVGDFQSRWCANGCHAAFFFSQGAPARSSHIAQQTLLLTSLWR